MPVLILALVLFASVAQAQTIDQYHAAIYAAGGHAPMSEFSFLAVDVTCDQAPTQDSGTTVNPRGFEWDDPANTGRVCRWLDGGSGPLFALPVGFAYELTLVAENTQGRSAESQRAGFSRLGAPAAPTGLRAVPPSS